MGIWSILVSGQAIHSPSATAPQHKNQIDKSYSNHSDLDHFQSIIFLYIKHIVPSDK